MRVSAAKQERAPARESADAIHNIWIRDRKGEREKNDEPADDSEGIAVYLHFQGFISIHRDRRRPEVKTEPDPVERISSGIIRNRHSNRYHPMGGRYGKQNFRSAYPRRKLPGRGREGVAEPGPQAARGLDDPQRA